MIAKDEKLTRMSKMMFHNGDLIFLSKGTYAGTRGIFLDLRSDPNWADVREENGVVRQHPVDWLAIRAAGQQSDWDQTAVDSSG